MDYIYENFQITKDHLLETVSTNKESIEYGIALELLEIANCLLESEIDLNSHTLMTQVESFLLSDTQIFTPLISYNIDSELMNSVLDIQNTLLLHCCSQVPDTNKKMLPFITLVNAILLTLSKHITKLKKNMDIEKLILKNKQLVIEKDTYMRIYELINFPIILTDAHFNIIDVNIEASNMLANLSSECHDIRQNYLEFVKHIKTHIQPSFDDKKIIEKSMRIEIAHKDYSITAMRTDGLSTSEGYMIIVK